MLNDFLMMSAFASTSPNGPTDARLERLAAGDLAAFESIFREFQGEVYGWIIRMVRDRGAAEDLTLETFWRIWKARRRFDPRRSFRAWARRIASNAAIDYLKRRSHDVSFTAEPRTDPSSDPAMSREIRDNIQRVFRELPAKLQVAAMLALIEEDPYQEIAEALGISVNGVKSRVFRAVRILRKKLTKMGIEP